jgi:hypothetical protein
MFLKSEDNKASILVEICCDLAETVIQFDTSITITFRYIKYQFSVSRFFPRAAH